MSRLTAAALAVAAFLGLSSASIAAADTSVPSAPLAVETLRAIQMTDQEGRPFTLHDALGRIVVLNFVFTGCGDVCPTQTADLALVQSSLPPELRSRIQFLSVSVDPEHDFPAALRSFAEARNVDFANWRFLTGTPDAIHAVAGFFGARPPAATPDAVTRHATIIHLFAPNGQSVMRYVGSPLDGKRLQQDIASLSTLSTEKR